MRLDSKRLPRLAILLPDARAGGAEWVSVLLGKEFARRGWMVDFVFMHKRGELLDRLEFASNIVNLNARRFRNGIVPLVRYFRSVKPDAMLANMWPLSGIAPFARVASGSRSRVVVVEHTHLSVSLARSGLGGSIHRRFGKLLYQMANGVVAVSQGVKDDLTGLAGLSPQRVTVIYNPVRSPDISVVPDDELLKKWHGGSAAIVAVGSLKEAKQYPTLLQAFERMGREEDARLLILGDGPLRGTIEQLVVSLGLEGRVLMPGFVPDPYPYLARADLFVLSSAREGLPGVLIEALVAGVPVVSTDCPSGPAEILDNGRYGRLVPVGNPQALADAMANALEARHDRELLRRRGNEFSVQRAADQYLALLDPGSKWSIERASSDA